MTEETTRNFYSLYEGSFPRRTLTIKKTDMSNKKPIYVVPQRVKENSETNLQSKRCSRREW